MENHIKMDDLGVPLFQETPKSWFIMFFSEIAHAPMNQRSMCHHGLPRVRTAQVHNVQSRYNCLPSLSQRKSFLRK